jgi:hypothetical protein
MFLFASSCSFDKEIEKPTQPLSNEVSEIKTWYEENYSSLPVSSQNEESKRSIKGKNDRHQILWNFDRKELLKSGKKFLSFGADNLENDSDFDNLEVIYNSLFLLYSNFSNNNIIRHELAFLKTLENAGLVLLKGNSQFSSYQKLSLNGNSVSAINC